jgi:Uma2 family endonuclease
MASSIRRPTLEQVDPPRSPRQTLPTMYDLPSESAEEPGLPDEFHDLQPQLLSHTLRLSHYTRDNCFTASDLNLYYDVNHPLLCKRPDWFLAIDVPRLYEGKDLRRSYVVWQEGRNPYVAIEFLSSGTEADDLGRFYRETPEAPNRELMLADSTFQGDSVQTATPPSKIEVYERYLRVPHYLVYSRYTQQLRYFKLDGGRYQEQSLEPQKPLVWLADLDIGVGLWEGVFEDVPGLWLRWCDRQGHWLLTDAEQSQAQLLQAAQNLLATGMPVEQVAQLLGLSDQQIAAIQTA